MKYYLIVNMLLPALGVGLVAMVSAAPVVGTSSETTIARARATATAVAELLTPVPYNGETVSTSTEAHGHAAATAVAELLTPVPYNGETVSTSTEAHGRRPNPVHWNGHHTGVPTTTYVTPPPDPTFGIGRLVTLPWIVTTKTRDPGPVFWTAVPSIIFGPPPTDPTFPGVPTKTRDPNPVFWTSTTPIAGATSSSVAVGFTTPIAGATSSSVAVASTTPADPVQLSVSLSIAPATPSTTVEPITTAEASTTAKPSTTAEPTTSSTSAAETSAEARSTSSSSTSTATDIDEDFPSGTIECSVFPSAYGAVYIDWLNLEGWTGVQETPNYTPGDKDIVYIAEKISGGCSVNAFCSYACPEGYQKSQWPEAQGSTGESIGGLYCNADGYLEMSNSNFSTICIEGTGSISVVNHLAEQVVICRTDYPGYESETIPLVATAGGTHQLTCPDASNYYTWEGHGTSAEYYVNPAGATEAEACVWGESGTDLGNWAPVNFGVGMDTFGITWISLIPNTPTNPDGVLNMAITIKGDTSGDCYYSNGLFYDSDGENAHGCTVVVTGSAYYEITEI